jgi:hypothetical protein
MGNVKFIGYFRLVEACGEPGCPVCRCVLNESRGYLDALLYEQVTDPDTRRRIRASWGFCNWHTWMLLEIEQSIFGASIVYEDLVNLALRRTERLRDQAGRPRRRRWLSALVGRRRRSTIPEEYRRRPACPACANAADTEKRCLETLLAFVDDADLELAYARSDGLCLPHLFAAVDRNGERAGALTLVDRTRAKWVKLGQDLGSFVGKHDYRNREPYSAAEVASYTRAFEMLAGAKSLFGNDLHSSEPLRSKSNGRGVRGCWWRGRGR